MTALEVGSSAPSWTSSTARKATSMSRGIASTVDTQ